MGGLTPLRFPVALPMWGVAGLKATRCEARDVLGQPHFVETDPRRTCGGEEDWWAYLLPSGQRVLVTLDVTIGEGSVLADPPDAGPALRALRLPAGNVHVAVHAEPWEMK